MTKESQRTGRATTQKPAKAWYRVVVHPDKSSGHVVSSFVMSEKIKSKHTNILFGKLTNYQRLKLQEADLSASEASALVENSDESFDSGKKHLDSFLSEHNILPGQRLNSDKTSRVLLLIAEDSHDVFGTTENAIKQLNSDAFMGGLPVAHLVRDGRVVSVLARINELRFGTDG